MEKSHYRKPKLYFLHPQVYEWCKFCHNGVYVWAPCKYFGAANFNFPMDTKQQRRCTAALLHYTGKQRATKEVWRYYNFRSKILAMSSLLWKKREKRDTKEIFTYLTPLYMCETCPSCGRVDPWKDTSPQLLHICGAHSCPRPFRSINTAWNCSCFSVGRGESWCAVSRETHHGCRVPGGRGSRLRLPVGSTCQLLLTRLTPVKVTIVFR